MPLQPSQTAPLLWGSETQPEMFSYLPGDPVSLAMKRAPWLMQWIPSRGVNGRNVNVKYIYPFMPTGWTGEQEYIDFIASSEAVAECDFPATSSDIQILEWADKLYDMKFSNKDKPTSYQHYGLQQWVGQERRSVAHSSTYQDNVYQNDADMVAAGLMERMLMHMDWNSIHGDPAFQSQIGTWNGLHALTTKNYIHNKVINEGFVSAYLNPTIVNGLSLIDVNDYTNTAMRVAKATQKLADKLLRKMFGFGYVPAMEDNVVVMGPTMWNKISEAIAGGALTGMVSSGIVMHMTPEAWNTELSKVRMGGLGEGAIPINGSARTIPVITDTMMERNVPDLGNGKPGVIGDIYILNRKYREQNLFEHLWMNWNLLDPMPTENTMYLQNGSVRAIHHNEEDVCWWMSFDRVGNTFCYGPQFQGKIQTVMLETDFQNDLEAESPIHEDWWIYGGAKAGEGNVLIQGLGA